MHSIDSNLLMPSLEKIFRAARQIVMPFYKSAALNVENKSDSSPVTQADKELNAFFIRELTQLIPNSVVVGEEENSTERLQEALNNDSLFWVLDPLDGTREFIAGTEEWAMMLALYLPSAGVQLSVVYQPTKQLFYWAAVGKGAHCKNLETQEQGTLQASQRSRCEESIMLTSKSRMDLWVKRFTQNNKFLEYRARGSIGLKAIDIACGNSDLYLNGEGKCGPWDILPCLLLLSESGAACWSHKEFHWDHELVSKNVRIPFAFGNKALLSTVEKELANALHQEVKTQSGLTAADFFASPQSITGKKRAVFTIGISGSGKSYWADVAAEKGWKVFQSDTLRVTWLEMAQRKGEKLMVDGKLCVPDPQNVAHIFCDELRDKVMDLEFLTKQIDPKRPLVFDITNLTLQRVPLMQAVLKAGFEVEALVFVPNTLEVHTQNVSSRSEQRGGLYVSPEVISILLSNFNVFCRNLNLNTQGAQELETLSLDTKVNFKTMRKAFHSYEDYLSSLSPDERISVENLKKADVFQSIEYVDVKPYFA